MKNGERQKLLLYLSTVDYSLAKSFTTIISLTLFLVKKHTMIQRDLQYGSNSQTVTSESTYIRTTQGDRLNRRSTR